MAPFPTVPEIPSTLFVALVFAGTLAVFLVGRWFLLTWLKRLTQRTETKVDEIVVEAIRLPSLFWAVALAAHAALRESRLPAHTVDFVANGVAALVIFSVSIVVANVLGGVLAARLHGSAGAGASGIARTLVRGLVLLVGLSMVLHQLGVAVGPLLTALGVGGLAVALALQDTLGNLFAGIHILLERPFAIGHFIKLEGGEAGWVQDIGWRTTRILTLADHTVVVPNAKIAGSTVVNMHLPGPVVRVEFTLGLAYGTDSARAEAVLLDELHKAIAELPQLVAEPGPDVLLENLGDWSLDFVLRFHIKQVSFERVALSRVRARAYERVRREGLEIPFPVQTVHLVRPGGEG